MSKRKTLPRTLFDAIYERDRGFCLLALPGCDGEGGVLDHRANRGHGGSTILDDPRNLILACAICNGSKADGHAIVLNDLEWRGLYVRKAATNAKTLQRAIDTPVEYLDGERFWLISATERRHISEGRS